MLKLCYAQRGAKWCNCWWNVAPGILSIYLYIIVLGVFNVCLEVPYIGIFYWIILGMGMAIMKMGYTAEKA